MAKKFTKFKFITGRIIYVSALTDSREKVNMNKIWLMIPRIIVVVALAVVVGNQTTAAADGESCAPSQAQRTPEELKTSLMGHVYSFCSNKQDGQDYLDNLEQIACAVNDYIRTHNPPRWDVDAASWFPIICRPLQFCRETVQFYSRICTAIETGNQMNPKEERNKLEKEIAAVEKVNLNAEERKALKNETAELSAEEEIEKMVKNNARVSVNSFTAKEDVTRVNSDLYAVNEDVDARNIENSDEASGEKSFKTPPSSSGNQFDSGGKMLAQR